MAIKVLRGDCRDVLRSLPEDSFDCCVTSPPYWGLRDYGVDGQIGLEPTMQEYLATMVDVFREVRRVLKPGGTFWLNIGDSYARQGGTTDNTASTRDRELSHMAQSQRRMTRPSDGLKPKDLCMIPNRLAILLQEDGWYVRAEIIWHKPNPMPESVTDRPTSAHEKVWLLTKREKYFYDADAIKETAIKAPMPMQASAEAIAAKSKGPMARGSGVNHQFADPERLWAADGKRNARNVWTITTKPFRGAHFATMPAELAERCIKAGCPAGGMVLDPFGGAGTTGLAAVNLGRRATLIELNPDYATLAEDRVAGEFPLFVV